MRTLIRNLIIVVSAILISVWAIIPPEEKLRRGKDLAGGVSLVYPVEIEARENAKDTLSRMIEVLKKRVNPTGALDISMVAQGANRIEISMPLPSDRVRELRRKFDATLDDLRLDAIEPSALEHAIREAPPAREQALAALAHGSEDRLRTLRDAAEAFDASRSARAAFEEARKAGADASVVDPLVEAAAAAEIAYDEARTKALAAALNPDEVRNALELPNDAKTVLDRENNEAVTIPSPRQRALERLRAHRPEAATKLDAAIAAFDAYTRERKGLDDPSDLIRILRGAGVLNFRIALTTGEAGPDESRLRQELKERGPKGVRSTDARWYPIEDIETWYESVQDFRLLAADPVAFFASRGFIGAERDGVYYMLLHDSPGLRLTEEEGEWGVANAFSQPDHNGLPGIGFTMDAVGAKLLGELTGANVGRPMAIVLDDKVYTAPRLNSRISVSGIIEGGSGGFKQEEVDYIVRTLRAGSLAAKLAERPELVNATGPELGADNLRKGLIAGIYSFIGVSICMVLWYFTCGVIAVIGLSINVLLLLGLMALGNAAFTMPGIAGVILAFGMAVDSNVLIYERIREELRAGQPLRAAIRIAFHRASAAIIDGNLCHLLTCFALYWTGTTEIRGFAVSLGIGVVTTLFAAMIVTRLLFELLLLMGWKTVKTLPDVIPALNRALLPNINWMGIRWVFYSFSVVLMVVGVIALGIQGKDMFDNEFRGGTAVTIELKRGDAGANAATPAPRLQRTRLEIEDQLHEYVTSLGQGSPAAPMIGADVIAINPGPDKVTSSTFKIKTVVTDLDVVSGTIIAAFPDLLDAHPPVRIASSAAEPVLVPVLGENIGRPDIRDDIRPYVGGVVVVVEGLDPPVSLDDFRARLRQTRSQPAYADAVSRPNAIVVIEGTPAAIKSAAVVTNDPSVSYFDDEARWRADVSRMEERLTVESLERGATLSGVQSFSAAIASDFVGKAFTSAILSIAGILIYLWVRFGSVRYSLAAVAADAHAAIGALGLVAIVNIIYVRAPGAAAVLGLAPFKINLAMTAAILTVLGYALNDSIVVMDRIRENRGKLAYASKEIVNQSLNQTLSRTLLTGGTTLLSSLVLYIFGGDAIRGFAFAIFIGVLCGTYSSLGIAAPIVWARRGPASRPQGAGQGAPGHPAELARA